MEPHDLSGFAVQVFPVGVYGKLVDRARNVPVDLALVVTGVALAIGAVLYLRSTPVRTLFGLLFVLFVPGYAVVAALFPESGDRSLSGDQGGRNWGATGEAAVDSAYLLDPSLRISGLERAVLSLGVSVVIAPLVGLGLSVSLWRLRSVPIVVTLGATGAGGLRDQIKRAIGIDLMDEDEADEETDT